MRAKVTLSPLMEDIRGKVGDSVFRRTADGQLIIGEVPDMSVLDYFKNRHLLIGKSK